MKITKLKGEENYDQWRGDIECQLKMNLLWQVATNRDPRPPPFLAGYKATEEETRERRDRVNAWEEKDSQASAFIAYSCEEGPKNFIKGKSFAHDCLEALKRYETSGLASADIALRELVSMKASDYKNIAEYTDNVARVITKIKSMQRDLPDWIANSLYRRGLSNEMAPLLFQMIQQASREQKEPDLGEMAVALTDYERRLEDDKKDKAAGAYIGKPEGNPRGRSRGQGKSKRNQSAPKDDSQKSNNTNNKGKTTLNESADECNYCNMPGHKETRCFYLHADLRRDTWRPARGKEHLAKHWNAPGKVAKGYSGKPIEWAESLRIRSVKVTQINKATSTVNDGEWYLDSGAGAHFTNDKTELIDVRKSTLSSVMGVDDTEHAIECMGTAILNILIDGKPSKIKLIQVHYSPQIASKLISLGQLASKGCSIHASGNRMTITDDELDQIILQGTNTKDSQFVLLQPQSKAIALKLKSSARSESDSASWERWHQRLAHLNYPDIKRLAELADGLAIDKKSKMPRICEACIMGKQHRCPSHRKHRDIAAKRAPIGKVIHADLAGGGNITRTPNGGRFAAALTDEGSDHVTAFVLKQKSDFKYCLRAYLQQQVTSGRPVEAFHSDNGGEFDGEACQEILREYGVRFESTAPGNPHQNGIAERTFRTLFERVRALLYDSGLPETLWGEALMTVVYLKNRSPCKILKYEATPLEAWTGKKPSLNHLVRFGSIAYHHDENPQGKLSPRSRKMIFVGYGTSSNHYRLWDPDKRQIIVSTHVIFDEDHAKSELRGSTDESFSEALQFFHHDLISKASKPFRPIGDIANESTIADPDPGLNEDLDEGSGTELSPEEEDSDQGSNGASPEGAATDEEDINGPNLDEAESGTESDPHPNPPVRNKHQSKQGDAAITPRERHPREAKIDKDFRHIDNPWNIHHGGKGHADPGTSKGGFSIKSKAFLSQVLKSATKVNSLTVPKNFREAMASPEADHWHQATDEEILNLKQNKVWRLVKRQKGMNIIPGRWVFALKLGPSGEVIRYKARWVAKGFRQIEGVDYDETYASVVKSMVWKLLLALAARYDLEVEQADVISAFLEASLPENERVYVQQPHGYEEAGDLVCHMLQALYGLKQACHEWYGTLAELLVSLGFKILEKDQSVFVNEATGVIIAAYVDDLMFLAQTKEEINKLKKTISTRFRMKWMGPISLYLGLQITRDRPNRRLYISQEAYIKRIASEFGMTEANKIKTPMEQIKIEAAKEDYIASASLKAGYMALVGHLTWIAITSRPDVSYSVGVCCRYLQNPTKDHFQVAKRILRYLNGTANYRVCFGPRNETDGELLGCTDSSYGDCEDTGRSTSGYVFYYWNGPVSWTSNRQKLTTLSTAEAEYVGATNAAKEMLFLQDILKATGHQSTVTPRLQTDNQAALQMASKPNHSARTKHFRIRTHFLHECIAIRKHFSIEHIPSERMPADGLTKPLAPTKFQTFRDMIGLVPGEA